MRWPSSKPDMASFRSESMMARSKGEPSRTHCKASVGEVVEMGLRPQRLSMPAVHLSAVVLSSTSSTLAPWRWTSEVVGWQPPVEVVEEGEVAAEGGADEEGEEAVEEGKVEGGGESETGGSWKEAGTGGGMQLRGGGLSRGAKGLGSNFGEVVLLSSSTFLSLLGTSVTCAVLL